MRDVPSVAAACAGVGRGEGDGGGFAMRFDKALSKRLRAFSMIHARTAGPKRSVSDWAVEERSVMRGDVEGRAAWCAIQPQESTAFSNFCMSGSLASWSGLRAAICWVRSWLRRAMSMLR